MKLTKEYSYLNNIVLTHINDLIKDLTDSDFDEERFNWWLEEKKISTKNNPSAYVKSCFKKELELGTFTKPEAPDVEYVPATQIFFNQLREKGIQVIPEDTMYIDCTFSYLLNNGILTVDELRALNQNIVDYMVGLNKPQSTHDFLELMRKSNTLKGRFVDWVAIGKEAADLNKEWERLLAEIKGDENEEDDELEIIKTSRDYDDK